MGITNADELSDRIFPDAEDTSQKEFFISKLGLKKTNLPASLDTAAVIFASWFPDPGAESMDIIKNDFINDKLVSPDIRATPAFFASILLMFKSVLKSLREED